MNRINLWFKENLGYFWDDSEDHGGFDRCIPNGPHSSVKVCLQDAANCFDCSQECLAVEEGNPPVHYMDQE